MAKTYKESLLEAIDAVRTLSSIEVAAWHAALAGERFLRQDDEPAEESDIDRLIKNLREERQEAIMTARMAIKQSADLLRQRDKAITRAGRFAKGLEDLSTNTYADYRSKAKEHLYFAERAKIK